MILGEMLSELKKEKEDLKRLRGLRKETFWVEKAEKPVINTSELNKKIQEKTESVRKKKLAVSKRNLHWKRRV